jgi:predicted TIM-barrel fold metal-dependent hydrolase
MIDIHTHLHPPRLFAAIRKWFAERSDWRLEHSTEPADVVRVLREAGVERFVFCSYAHKTGMARELNAWLAQTSRNIGGYGLPLATVHLEDPQYLEDIRLALDDGCIGLKIHENVQQLAIDDPRFAPVFALLAQREAFVLVHVGPVPWHQDTNGGPRRIAGVLERHPGLRIVVAHMGVPDTREYFAMIPQYPNLFIDTTMAFASKDLRTTVSGEEIERASGAIVYGTDYPNIPFPYDADRRIIEQLGLSDVAHAAIFAGNARRLSPRLAHER